MLWRPNSKAGSIPFPLQKLLLVLDQDFDYQMKNYGGELHETQKFLASRRGRTKQHLGRSWLTELGA